MRYFLIYLFSAIVAASAYGQSSEHVPGQILLSLEKEVKGSHLERPLADIDGQSTQLKVIQQVSPFMNIWLMEFDVENIDEQAMLRALQEHPRVLVAQFNHKVTHRAVPNDALFEEQWQYINDGSNGGVVDADIDADEAWEITTGGLTAQGDEIVAAVLDDGIDLSHPDFEDNRWQNTQEIPDNGIDDDGNGYTDDFEGWSTVTNSDNIAGGGHGTPVAGIIGAKGNNGIGVTGVNWDVKVMVIKNNFNTNEAAVIAAYSYALTMRQMYNESNGAEGAFVVSTNASWGVDFGNPDNAPLWCGFYDIMGEHGILSCGATINGNQNVDVIGDLPTACPSDFMISVTNCDNTDNKVTNAGYGAETIDLGAHGANAYTTSLGGGYGGFGGTSGATPHVTGAIALLYSAPCPSFIALAKSDPEAAALLARQYILDGVDPNASLDGITTTGGRLNLKNSLDLLLADCAEGGCFPPYALSVEQDELNYILNWESYDETLTFNLRYRAVGDVEWSEMNGLSNNAFIVSDLLLCTEYEFQVQAICEEEESEFTDSFIWTTDGCCEPPSLVEGTDLTNESITVAWNSVLAATGYDVRFRVLGTDVWTEISDIDDVSLVISDLMICTSYEVQVRTQCENEEITDYSPLVIITTEGCGACTDMIYCPAFSDDSSEEWISHVSLNNIGHSSGSDNGYGEYTHISTTLDMGETYELSVTPDYAGDNYDEYFTAWIDFDQNGIFEADELVLDSDGLANTTVSSSFEIPIDALAGGTRLRIIMRYNTMAGPCQQGFNYGEVEDYCVIIVDPATGTNTSTLDDFKVFPNPASHLINVVLSQDFSHQNHEIILLNALGQQVARNPIQQQNITMDVSNHPAGVYQLCLAQNGIILSRKSVILSK